MRKMTGKKKLVAAVCHTKVKGGVRKQKKPNPDVPMFAASQSSHINKIKIQKKKTHSSPGNAAHIPLDQLTFCTYCNKHTKSMPLHVKRSKQHGRNVATGVQYWYCDLCGVGHQEGHACKQCKLSQHSKLKSHFVTGKAKDANSSGSLNGVAVTYMAGAPGESSPPPLSVHSLCCSCKCSSCRPGGCTIRTWQQTIESECSSWRPRRCAK